MKYLAYSNKIVVYLTFDEFDKNNVYSYYLNDQLLDKGLITNYTFANLLNDTMYHIKVLSNDTAIFDEDVCLVVVCFHTDDVILIERINIAADPDRQQTFRQIGKVHSFGSFHSLGNIFRVTGFYKIVDRPDTESLYSMCVADGDEYDLGSG